MPTLATAPSSASAPLASEDRRADAGSTHAPPGLVLTAVAASSRGDQSTATVELLDAAENADGDDDDDGRELEERENVDLDAGENADGDDDDGRELEEREDVDVGGEGGDGEAD